MSGNLENLGQGDATLIAERDTMNAARIHLTDYREHVPQSGSLAPRKGNRRSSRDARGAARHLV